MRKQVIYKHYQDIIYILYVYNLYKYIFYNYIMKETKEQTNKEQTKNKQCLLFSDDNRPSFFHNELI